MSVSRLSVRSIVAHTGIAVMACGMSTAGAEPPKGGGTTPPMKIYACAGQLTRTPDATITMKAGKAFYEDTVRGQPVTTQPVVQNGSISVAEAKAKACTRRVIEIHVPSTASSGCPDCYPNAEIHVCAAKFAGSKDFEEHCHVPVSSTSAADCKTFSHPVEVYKKPNGAKSFNLTALKTFHYRGFMDSTGCRVAAKNLGQIHDTAEVYANVTPPKSGTDIYRVLTLPRYKDALLESVIFIEFEKRRR
jgi:hypothetical protein